MVMEMEKENKRKKRQKKGNTEKRSPLQDLNGHQIQKTSCKKSSIHSSSSSAPVITVEASKCCSRFLLSSNLCSASSSRTLPNKNPKSFSKLASNAPRNSTAGTSKVPSRFNENEVPKRPLPQKSTNHVSCPNQMLSGKNNTKPISKSGQRSDISSCPRNPAIHLKKGSQNFEEKRSNSRKNGSGKPFTELFRLSDSRNLNFVEKRTPVGKIASACGLDFETLKNDSVSETANSNGATSVKTPPVEASVSPEIENGSHSKMLVVSKSGVTPVCYGAGHLVSGVTDKRKCRRRGSLKGGFERAKLFHNEGNPVTDSAEYSIPMLAEASVRWRLSPCDEGHEDQGSGEGNRVDRYRVVRADDDSYVKVGLLSSSPSSLCGDLYNSMLGNNSGNGSAQKKGKARIVILSPRKDSEFKGFLELSNKKIDEHVLHPTTPSSTHHLVIGDNSTALSVGSLSSGNVIQTPNSGSSSDQSKMDVQQRRFVQSELDLITKALSTVDLSPGSELSMWDKRPRSADMASFSNSFGLNHIREKNVASFSSWVSDSTLENLSLSQMRISWRDGLEGRIGENDDEFDDCCRCLSDEEIGDAGECFFMNTESPEVLESKDFISAKEKDKFSLKTANMWAAESICTNGGGLVASGDSDWSNCFENDLFKV